MTSLNKDINLQHQPQNPHFIFSLFISPLEMNNLKKWVYKVSSDEWLYPYLDPFYNSLVNLIPSYITPNILTLAGFFSSLLSYYFSPNPLLFALFLFLYMVLDTLDGKQARKTLSSSPLGELFDHFCDSISNVLLTSALLHIFHIDNYSIHLSFILINNLLFQNEHLKAFLNHNKNIHFSRHFGPTQIIFYTLAISIFQFLFDFDFSLEESQSDILVYILKFFYYLIFLNNSEYFIKYKHFNLHNVFLNLSNAISFFFLASSNHYLLHGILFNLTTIDLMISKMASCNLHFIYNLIVWIGLLLPNSTYFILPIYFIIILYHLSTGLNLPILRPIIKIFVSGYYDGLHYGHINSLKEASQYGHRLIVGVHSDEDSQKYKNKKPMINGDIRCQKIEELPFVYMVIKDCQQIFDEEFIKKYQINFIGLSDEYLYSDGTVHPSYEYVQKNNKMIIIPRTPGISSSLLREQKITRIKE
jgi:cytidyltransferase-like protein